MHHVSRIFASFPIKMLSLNEDMNSWMEIRRIMRNRRGSRFVIVILLLVLEKFGDLAICHDSI